MQKNDQKEKKNKKRQILVTSALPYANGPIHLGHLVEYIQADIWVRYHKFIENEIYYFCADDTHGTPIMIAARNQGITPDEMVQKTHVEHYRDLSGFDVDFDNYYTTNSQENKELSELIYGELVKKGHIARRPVRQLYCEKDQLFLPDRFVKGICPECGAEDQYGDSCEVCSATYNPSELKNPSCSICGSSPIFRESDHLFFKLSDFHSFLSKWLSDPGRVNPGVRKKMEEWLNSDLRDWDISRDGPYFGFEIPGEKNKYFYVWLDAPIGYIASAMNYFNKTGNKKLFDQFWKTEDSEVHHFIGKDIIYFHTLFWPAQLSGGGFRTPTSVRVHGFLTLNGEKMSKSRGTLIRAETYLNHLDPSCLRFFYASSLSGSLDDIDLSVTEFMTRYNSHIVGNIVNIFSRLCSGISAKLDRTLSESLSEEGKALRKTLLDSVESVLIAYEDLNYAKAVREITSLGDSINKFLTDREPWNAVKHDPEAARQILTDCLASGRILAGLLKPILPVIASGVEELLNLPEPLLRKNLEWIFPPSHKIREYRHLAARVEEKAVSAMLDEEKERIKSAAKKDEEKDENKNKKHGKKMSETSVDGIITIEDLVRVDLCIGKILEAGYIDGADKLLRIVLDAGEGKPRQIFAGIRIAYKPEDLVGMLVVSVVNLAPRKMKFGISEGMLLAAGEGENLTLITPHRNAKPGDRLK
ncbi:MAG: methionine--tRNA ligase [Spirochaetia bacterium]|nr:methionine--tRNA ligase [Spirochaetia bacterium]